MFRNVGSTERWARLAVGTAAGVAALNTTGWQRGTLGAIAAAGLGTGLARYCPINQAVGRIPAGESPLEQGLRDTELRRHADQRSALGTAPTTDSGQPKVTPASDVFSAE